jgi:hypothetical protein
MTQRLLLALALLAAPAFADDDVPVPPEVQKLVETFFTAFKSADDAALVACWHTPEVLAQLRSVQATAEAATSPTPVDSAKEAERELKRRIKDNKLTPLRAAQMREQLTKRFGELSAMKLVGVELGEDDSGPAIPTYDDVEVRFTTADGSALQIGIDDIIQLDGVWKFKGRLESDITLELPDIDVD